MCYFPILPTTCFAKSTISRRSSGVAVFQIAHMSSRSARTGGSRCVVGLSVRLPSIGPCRSRPRKSFFRYPEHLCQFVADLLRQVPWCAALYELLNKRFALADSFGHVLHGDVQFPRLIQNQLSHFVQIRPRAMSLSHHSHASMLDTIAVRSWTLNKRGQRWISFDAKQPHLFALIRGNSLERRKARRAISGRRPVYCRRGRVCGVARRWSFKDRKRRKASNRD